MTGASRAAATKEVTAAVARIFTYAAWADKYDGAVHNAPMRNVTLPMHEPPGHRRFGLPRQRPVARPCLPG